MSMLFLKLLSLLYRLPPKLIVAGFFLASALFLELCRRYGRRRWFGVGTGMALLLWLAVAVWTTLLGRSNPAPEPPVWVPLYSHWEAFHNGKRELLRSNFMNLALFYPGGLLTARILPKAWSPRGRLITVLAFAIALSVGIELCQLHFALGKPEVDDVIHNALGALLGGGYYSAQACAPAGANGPDGSK